MPGPITVFTARLIHTMERALPTATAIAVRDGRIVEVGDLDSLQPWLRHHDHVIDARFADAVIMPGLIDPHLHPGLMALLLATEWVPPETWDLPHGRVDAVEGHGAFLARVAELHHGIDDPEEPLIVFGFHAQYHGDVVRADLDAISTTRPILVWQRSFHELRCNQAALAWVNADDGAKWDPHIDLESGRMFESGMVWALQVVSPYLMGNGKFIEGLRGVRQLVHSGGVTTIADAGFGIFDYDFEFDTYSDTIGSADTPFRTYLMPNVPQARARWSDDTMAQLEQFMERSTDRISFIRAAKFLADGAVIAQLMVVGEPGYIDGHQGAWLSEPAKLVRQIRPYWEANYDIHIHTSADVGVGGALDAIDMLLHEHPRFDHRTTLHHIAVSTPAQIRRMAGLGVQFSANPFYVYLYSDRFVDEWLGSERASQMTRLGSAVRNGLTVSLHSDLPMGPVTPLKAAQIAATRRTKEGTVMAAPEALTLYDALKSVTIDAAYQLRLDHEIGSLSSGKFADMVVLEADPFEVGADGLADIEIRATVVGGEVFPTSV